MRLIDGALDLIREAMNIGDGLSLSLDGRGVATLQAGGGGIIDPSLAPYHAPTDGIADATAEYQAAVNDAGALGHRLRVRSNVSYRLTDTLVMPAGGLVMFGEGTGGVDAGRLLLDHGNTGILAPNYTSFDGVHIVGRGDVHGAGVGIDMIGTQVFDRSSFAFRGGSITNTKEDCIRFHPDTGFYAFVADSFLMTTDPGATGGLAAGVAVRGGVDPRAVPRFMSNCGTYNSWMFDVSEGCENFLATSNHGFNFKVGPLSRKVIAIGNRCGTIGQDTLLDGTNNIFAFNVCNGLIRIQPGLNGSIVALNISAGSTVFDGTPPPKNYNIIYGGNWGEPRIMGHVVPLTADDTFVLEYAAQSLYNKLLLAIGGSNRMAPGTLYLEQQGNDSIVTFGSTGVGPTRMVLGRREYPSDTLHEMLSLNERSQVVVPPGIDLMIGDPDPAGGGVVRLRRNPAATNAPRLTFGTDDSGYSWGVAKNVDNVETSLLRVNDGAVKDSVEIPIGLWNSNPLKIGPSYVWHDPSIPGLRIKSSAPTSATDGAGLGGTTTQLTTTTSSYTTPPLALGVYRLWLDGAGLLRIKAGTPTSATDGAVVGSSAPQFATSSASYATPPLALGGYRLWVDATGKLRIKSGSPTTDLDGATVGAAAAGGSSQTIDGWMVGSLGASTGPSEMPRYYASYPFRPRVAGTIAQISVFCNVAALSGICTVEVSVNGTPSGSVSLGPGFNINSVTAAVLCNPSDMLTLTISSDASFAQPFPTPIMGSIEYRPT